MVKEVAKVFVMARVHQILSWSHFFSFLHTFLSPPFSQFFFFLYLFSDHLLTFLPHFYCSVHTKNLLCSDIGISIGIGNFCNQYVGYRYIDNFHIGAPLGFNTDIQWAQVLCLI